MNTRLFQIDLFRIIAALMVLFYHFGFRSAYADGWTALREPGLALISKFGYLGVHLFFMISGFVILMSAQGNSFMEFCKSRFIRLFPVYWAACVLSTLAALAFAQTDFMPSVKVFLANLTMIHSIAGISSIDSVYWTLAVEMRFYALVGLLLLLKQMPYFERYLWAWLGLCLLCIILPIKALQFIIIDQYAPFFIAGASFYSIYSKQLSLSRMGILTLSLGLALYQNWNHHPDKLDQIFPFYENQITSFMFVAMWVVFGLLSLRKLEFLNQPLFYYAGILTYPLYLIHQNLGIMTIRTSYEFLGSYGSLALALILSLLGALFLHYGVEKPSSRWLKKHLQIKKAA